MRISAPLNSTWRNAKTRRSATRRAGRVARAEPHEVFAPHAERRPPRRKCDGRRRQAAVDEEVTAGENREREQQAAVGRRVAEERLHARREKEQPSGNPDRQGEVAEVEEHLRRPQPVLPPEHEAVERQRDRARLRPEQQDAREREHLGRREVRRGRRDLERDAPADDRQRDEHQHFRRHAVADKPEDAVGPERNAQGGHHCDVRARAGRKRSSRGLGHALLPPAVRR